MRNYLPYDKSRNMFRQFIAAVAAFRTFAVADCFGEAGPPLSEWFDILQLTPAECPLSEVKADSIQWVCIFPLIANIGHSRWRLLLLTSD